MTRNAQDTGVGELTAPRPTLAVNEVSCERDERQLFSELTFSLFPGEAVRIAGANGSGKTTLMRGLVGLNIYLSGQVEWIDEGTCPYLYIGHRPGISSHLTVLENLRYLSRLHGVAATDDHLMSALSQVGLAAFDDSMGNQLSAGQQRRVVLALLYLEGMPECWVLDEPFTALDRQGVAALERHLSAHCASGGSVLFSTHHEPQGVAYRTLWLGRNTGPDSGPERGDP